MVEQQRDDLRHLQALILMELFGSRVAINSVIALFILVVPLFSGNPITWWNVGGAVAVFILTVLTRKWYRKHEGPRSDRTSD